MFAQGKGKVRFALSVAALFLLGLGGCGVVGYGGRVAQQKPTYHVVSPGETLYGISQQYDIGIEQLAMLNGIRDRGKLEPGWRLYVGYGRGRSGGGARPKKGSSQSVPVIDWNELASGNGKIGWPVRGGKLVSRFGRRWRSFHDGIDIAARTGTPVLAAHNAKVVYSGNRLSGYGNLVILRDKSGLTTVYAHNRRNVVRVGQKVRRGDKIAEVGSTGRSTGPHLHFEVRVKKSRNQYVTVDPIPLFRDKNRKKLRFRTNNSLTPILAKAY